MNPNADGHPVTTSVLEMMKGQQATWLVEQQRSWQRILAIPRVIQLVGEMRVGSTPHDVVFERGTLRLLRYRRETPALYREPVLFCYALINRYYILDLQPDKSVVRRYLDRGFDVYMIDWGVPSDGDHGLTLSDYVCRFLREVVEFVAGAYGREDVHLVGYCMGGTMGALFTALYPGRVKTLTLLAAPIEFELRESLLNVWTDGKYFDVDAFIDKHRNCPASFLQSCFMLMKPVQNLLEKQLALFEQLDDERFVTNYLAMEYWINDNIPMAGETFREFVKNLYQSNQLVRGQLRLRDGLVDLNNVRCPLLILTAKSDHLVAPPSTEGILPHVPSSDKLTMSIDGGHVGIVVGGKAHKQYWPAATRWLADRSTAGCVPARMPQAAD